MLACSRVTASLMKECPWAEHLASCERYVGMRALSSVAAFNYDKPSMPYLQRLNTLKEMIAPTMMYKQATSQFMLALNTEWQHHSC